MIAQATLRPRRGSPAASLRLGSAALLAAWLLVSFLARPQPVAAHPLGNFSVNRYSRLELDTEQIRLIYVLDMAEIPTFQRWSSIDRDGDGAISSSEQARFLDDQVAELQANLSLVINGQLLKLEPVAQTIEFPPGQADLPTLRVRTEFLAKVPSGQTAWDVDYRDGNYADRLGWREVVVHASSAVTVLDSTVPSQDISQELRQYPRDLLQSPLQANSARLRFVPASARQQEASQGAVPTTAVAAGRDRFGGDRFAELIALRHPSPGVLVMALLAAAGLGALHSLSPGHGKTVVGAYLVGSRGWPGTRSFWA